MSSIIASLISIVVIIHAVFCGDNKNPVVEERHNVSDPIEKARKLVVDYLNDTENKFIPGLVIGVSVKGEQKWLEGFGLANIENNVSMTGDAVMQIGSITKSFTFALGARLVQEGKLNLDLPIRNYLSVNDFPDKKWNGSVVNITLRQLFQMRAGIPNGPSLDEIGKCLRCKNQTDHLIFVRDKELDFEPGTNLSYSNFGYELAGAVIESVLPNKTFDAAMTEMIRDILKLNRTSIVDTEMIIPHLASFYSNDTEKLLNSGMWGHIFLNDGHAPGGIIATMSDLLTYGQAWLDAYYGRSIHFLDQSAVKIAWTPTDLNDKNLIPYGMGWFIQNDTVTDNKPSGSQVVWHSGGTFGCQSMLAIYPEREIIVAASVNSGEYPIDEFILQSNIAGLFANIK